MLQNERLCTDLPLDICPEAFQFLHVAFRGIFLVGGELRCVQCDLVPDRISCEASYAERGLVFSVFRWEEMWLVGVAAGHVVAWDLGNIDGIVVLKIEYVEDIVVVIGCGKFYAIVCDCDCYARRLRYGRWDSDVQEIEAASGGIRGMCGC